MSRVVIPWRPFRPSGYSWAHRVAGSVAVNGVAARKRVTLLDRETLESRATQLSKSDGTFLFRGLPELAPGHSGWLVFVQDNIHANEPGDGTFNAIVADMVQPETGD